MNAGTAVVLLNMISAVFALIAAYLWYKSATVAVYHRDEPDENGVYSAAIITGNNSDFIQTVIAQSTMSKKAARAAALAALFQGAALLFHVIAA